MKKFSLLLILTAIFFACNIKEEVENNNGTIKDKEPEPVADFIYQRISPLIVEFTNTSSGSFIEYKWDFGDGTWSEGRDATKSFEKFGTYPVTLTVTTKMGYTYRKTAEINLTEPEIYFAGYTLYKIPYEGKYYKVVFKDDALLPSAWDFQTAYTPMLDNTDLPYSVTWDNPVMLKNVKNHKYYTIQVMRYDKATNTASGTQCLKQQLKVADILNYYPEYVLRTSTDGTLIGIKMMYDY